MSQSCVSRSWWNTWQEKESWNRPTLSKRNNTARLTMCPSNVNLFLWYMMNSIWLHRPYLREDWQVKNPVMSTQVSVGDCLFNLLGKFQLLIPQNSKPLFASFKLNDLDLYVWLTLPCWWNCNPTYSNWIKPLFASFKLN